MGQASSLENNSEKKDLSLAARFASCVIRFYQIAFSPLLGPTCRFYPTCSSYALEAIREHGFLKGSWLAVCRIGKCHPFHPGGVDFVPPGKSANKENAHDSA